jgi:hypothetical protein
MEWLELLASDGLIFAFTPCAGRSLTGCVVARARHLATPSVPAYRAGIRREDARVDDDELFPRDCHLDVRQPFETPTRLGVAMNLPREPAGVGLDGRAHTIAIDSSDPPVAPVARAGGRDQAEVSIEVARKGVAGLCAVLGRVFHLETTSSCVAFIGMVPARGVVQ